jgi:hypothetical protein
MSARTPDVLRVQLIIAALESISVPPGVYQKAIERYNTFANFLHEPGTVIASWNPDIYLQGSVALGIANKPPGRSEFDFDVTCETQPPSALSAMSVRATLEHRLREDANYARMLNTEKNRCLRLDYAKAEQFHLDIIASRTAKWVSSTSTGIQVPDRSVRQWIGSDPRGYILWFETRKKLVSGITYLSESERRNVIEASTAPAPEQPDPAEKSPLQWVIQIMKRHRDLMFSGPAPGDGPISIILTTLAAKAYRGEANIESALAGIADRLLDQFDDVARTLVLNPVIPSENFADKWKLNPQCRKAFFDWYERFSRDVANYFQATKIPTIGESLDSLVGKNAKVRAFSAHSEVMDEMQRRGQLGVISKAATIVPATVPGSRVIPAHTNYGTW